jgi:hypothetical protein
VFARFDTDPYIELMPAKLHFPVKIGEMCVVCLLPMKSSFGDEFECETFGREGFHSNLQGGLK